MTATLTFILTLGVLAFSNGLNVGYAVNGGPFPTWAHWALALASLGGIALLECLERKETEYRR